MVPVVIYQAISLFGGTRGHITIMPKQAFPWQEAPRVLIIGLATKMESTIVPGFQTTCTGYKWALRREERGTTRSMKKLYCSLKQWLELSLEVYRKTGLDLTPRFSARGTDDSSWRPACVHPYFRFEIASCP